VKVDRVLQRAARGVVALSVTIHVLSHVEEYPRAGRA
jgi:hypothetical protein